jgi:hypothetical protein
MNVLMKVKLDVEIMTIEQESLEEHLIRNVILIISITDIYKK